jgi:hypothetical protein
MRRALLLATVLAVPALGSAQNAPSGQITFTNTDADPAASFINLAECNGTAATPVEINWTVPAVAVTGMTFQLFASNKVSTGNCPTTLPDNTTTLVSVGQITNQSSLSVVNQPFDPALIASALSLNQNACALTTDTTIFLCVNALDRNSVIIGSARGQMTLSTYAPDVKPKLTGVGAGNGALTPAWSQNGSTNTQWYRVQLVSMANPAARPDPSWFDPSGGYTAFHPSDPSRHYSGYVNGSEVRVGGLQNGVTYAAAVTGYTAAYNASVLDASGIGTGVPEVSYDLWQVYQMDGGRETGGCSGGAAGPIGLALLAGALALTRRRK